MKAVESSIFCSFLILLLMACAPTSSQLNRTPNPVTLPAINCDSTPEIEQTIITLTSCHASDASVDEITHQLLRWDRLDDDFWGTVTEADIVSGGGEEVIIIYYPPRMALTTAKGRVAILQRQPETWQVLYDQSLHFNENDIWRYELVDAKDLTGDTFDELLFRLERAGRYSREVAFVVLSSQPNNSETFIHLIFEKTESENTTYHLLPIPESTTYIMQSTELFDYYHVTNRAYGFENSQFILIEESHLPRVALDIPAQYRHSYDQKSDFHIYQCNQESFARGRLCGMNSDGSQQQMIIDSITSAIFYSPDGEWLVFTAFPQNLEGNVCQNDLYKMSKSGELTSLLSYAELTMCTVLDVEWIEDEEGLWIQFRHWDGSAPSDEPELMPLNLLNFEDGTLMEID